MSTVVPQAVAADEHVMLYSVAHIDGSPIRPSPYFRWCTIWQRPVAALMLLAVAPLLLLMMLLVRLTSQGAALYRQTRVGRDGRIFTIYKIRSMYLNAEARTGAVWTTCSEDPRITPIGRFLRATHLDELPQLWNIVVGEMALVGPRPERPEFVRFLREEVPSYEQRLQILPGVTGLAQINLPADSDVESVRRKLELDLSYIARGSLFYDVRLIIATALPLLGVSNEYSAELLGVRQAGAESAGHRAAGDRHQGGSSAGHLTVFAREHVNDEADCEALSAK